MRWPWEFPQSKYESLAFRKQKNTVYAKLSKYSRKHVQTKSTIIKHDGTVLLTQDEHTA